VAGGSVQSFDKLAKDTSDPVFLQEINPRIQMNNQSDIRQQTEVLSRNLYTKSLYY
jgi:hypothetical protein